MIVYLSEKLDDMNLSPEAFRLYVHLRCQAAKAAGEDGNSSILIIPSRLDRVLERIRIPVDTSANLELERRRLVSFRYDWEERETHVIFHSEGMWQ